MQKWGWGFVSLGLLIFITTMQGKAAFVILSVLIVLIGGIMVKVGDRQEKAAQEIASKKGGADTDGNH
ncbi:MAG: hypothetical protein LBS41_05890 [Streptococcaceae bacterium]|jgi:hypothetical protein|nr:hypothetical protein [Streptococcaceae bacterium]